jgi:hypothetical protein
MGLKSFGNKKSKLIAQKITLPYSMWRDFIWGSLLGLFWYAIAITSNLYLVGEGHITRLFLN